MNKNYLKRIEIGFKKCAPTILTIAASGGVILTAVLTSKATKAASLKENKDDSIKNKLKRTFSCYIPPIVIGTATIACILGANVLNKRSQAALAGAYALISSSYSDYRRKNIELHGEKAHKDILEALEVEKAKRIDIHAQTITESCFLTSEDDNEEIRLFHDAFSDRYFESTLSKVIEAEYHLNRNYSIGGCVSLNNFYEFLGISPIKEGDDLVWSYSSGLCWIDFDNSKIVLDDGLECYLITMVFDPMPPEEI